MKKILLTVSILVSGFAFAQSSKLKKADNYYNLLSYSYAEPLYEDLIGSEVDNTQMRSRLARSYYQTGDMAKAKEMYASFVERSDASKEDYFYYAQSLKQTGDYATSDQWMQRFNTSAQNDLRAESFETNTSYMREIKGQAEYFSIGNLSINTSSSDFGGYPSADGKTWYFLSSRSGRAFVKNEWSWTNENFLDIYQAGIRTDHTLENAKRLSKEVNSKYHEGPLCYSPDKKTVYFTRNNNSSGKDNNGILNLRMYKATVNADGSWSDIVDLPCNSNDYSVGHPSVSADGKTLYFASNKPGGYGGSDLYKAAINTDGSFGEWINLGKEFNTEGQEMFPWISQDGNLFFSSDGLIGLGGLDVFVALKGNKGFSKVMNAGLPINSQNDDFAFVMSSDNIHGFFSSNRAGGKGNDDIYSFVQTRQFIQPLSVSGVLTELRSGEVLSGATVKLLDESGKVVETATTNEKGEYVFNLEREKGYKVEGAMKDYFGNSKTFNTKGIDPSESKVVQNFQLEKDPGLSLYTLITDTKTNKAIDSVHVVIIDNITGQKFADIYTDEKGDFLKAIADKKIGSRVSYNIKLSKSGYFPKEITFNHEVKEAGMIKVHEVILGALSMDQEVKDLREMVELKPIKFDLGKSTIRPDAAAELDKIITILNKYPGMVIELGAHTDCRGTKAANQKLSDARAKSSAAYIKSRITNPNRVSGKGYGESRLVNGCVCEGTVKSTCSEEEHQENRRTEFVVVSY